MVRDGGGIVMTTNKYQRLGRAARTELDALVDQSKLSARILESVLDAAPQQRTALWRWPALALGTTLCAAAVAMLVLWPAAPVTFTIAGEGLGQVGDSIAANDLIKLVAFSEGTTVGITAHGRAKIVRAQHEGADVVVESGTVQANIAHKQSTQWTFRAGPYSVFVTGTKFDLKWDTVAKRMTLSMQEGRVLVSGGAITTPREVRAGEVLDVSENHDERIAPATLRPPVSPVETEKAEPTPNKKRLAFAYPTAPKVLEKTLSPAATLFAQADRVRLQGDERAAVALFEKLATDFPRDRLAGLASFAAGRLWLLQLHDPKAALFGFERARRLGLGSPLDEDCHARIIEALGLLKNFNACATEQARYLASFPKGPHVDIVAKACR